MISIDYREEKSSIIDLFKNQGEIRFEIKNLYCADYVIENKIDLERKEADDFCVSMTIIAICAICQKTKFKINGRYLQERRTCRKNVSFEENSEHS